MAEKGIFTPENIVNTTIKSTVEAGAIVLPPLGHVVRASLPGLSWAVDELFKRTPGLRLIQQETSQKWRAAAYRKGDHHGK